MIKSTASEVDIITEYLLNKHISDRHVYDLYDTILASSPGKDERIVRVAFSHPRLLPFLDAALVFVRPHSELRRRIHIVFSILETSPAYSNEFISEKVTFFGFLALIGVGLRGIYRLLIGLIIVRIGRL